MGLMDKMMDKMIGKMRPEEKQKMMLKMMPMMMEDVNMTELMVKMMPEMLKNINALDIFNLLKQALLNLPKLIKVIKENLPESMKEKLPKIAKEMMPVVCQRVMPTMMEGLTMDNMMPSMMKEMMPDCLWYLLPKMPNEMRVDFISNITGIMVQQGSVEMSEKEKEDLIARIIERVKIQNSNPCAEPIRTIIIAGNQTSLLLRSSDIHFTEKANGIEYLYAWLDRHADDRALVANSLLCEKNQGSGNVPLIIDIRPLVSNNCHIHVDGDALLSGLIVALGATKL